MSTNKPLTWEAIPKKLREWIDSMEMVLPAMSKDKNLKTALASDIMEAMKPELEKAFDAGTRQEDISHPHDFETWYNKTYNK